jgi:DNA-binding NarL/FixJ family response regulator
MAMSGAAEPAFGALDIKNKVVIQFLSDIFECIWSSALPYTAAETGYQGVVDEIQKTIANLLADGFTDEVIARRLDMSLRTCRRHIAALLSNLNSVSRFQAGVQAAKGGLIDGT